MLNFKNKISTCFPPSLFLILNIFLFGTFTVYLTNSSEFQTSYTQVIANLLIPAISSLILLLLISTILNHSLNKFFSLLIFSLGILTYIHGNLLLWDYGVLDGNALDLSNNWRLWSDIFIWVFIFTIIILFKQALLNKIKLICILLIFIQLTAGCVQYLQSPINLQINNELKTPPKLLSQFSKSNNVVHIILDAFQPDVFEELYEETPDYGEIFSGFTFYKNATTSSAVTYLSVPASLSSKTFQNNVPISEYIKNALQGDNLYTLLHNNDFEIDVSTPLTWNAPNKKFSSYYQIPLPYTNENHNLSTALTILDLSLFRQAPHFLKSNIYNSQAWLFSNYAPIDHSLRFEHHSHNAFLQELTSKISITNRRATYKFIHLVTPHAPMVSNKDCSYPGNALEYNRINYKQQAQCTMHNIVKFIKTLKTIGIYDSTTIVIHGDHGGGIEFDMEDSNGNIISSTKTKLGLWGAPIPLVLVKPSNTSGPLRISESEVQLSDIPITISSLLGLENSFSGRAMHEISEDESIERYYYWSDIHRNDASAKDFFDYLYTYRINGSIYKEDSWSSGNVLASSFLDSRHGYDWGDRITFGNKGIAKLYQETGWSTTSSDFITWAHGPESALKIPLPKTDKAIKLIVSIKPFIVKGKLDKQRVDIFIGGNNVGKWDITENKFHERNIIIPSSFFSENKPLEIRFKFYDATSPADLGVNKDIRHLSLAFRHIIFQEL